jgi:hypothetical protein
MSLMNYMARNEEMKAGKKERKDGAEKHHSNS